jgi:hypothetical protein
MDSVRDKDDAVCASGSALSVSERSEAGGQVGQVHIALLRLDYPSAYSLHRETNER